MKKMQFFLFIHVVMFSFFYWSLSFARPTAEDSVKNKKINLYSSCADAHLIQAREKLRLALLEVQKCQKDFKIAQMAAEEKARKNLLIADQLVKEAQAKAAELQVKPNEETISNALEQSLQRVLTTTTARILQATP